MTNVNANGGAATNVLTALPQAQKRHPLLDRLAQDMQGLRETGTVEALGHTYGFQLLMPEGEDWVTANTPAGNLLTFALARRRYRFAAALTSIDGVAVEELWPPSAITTASFVVSERRQAVLAFIDAGGIDSNVLRLFDAAYDKLDGKRASLFDVRSAGVAGGGAGGGVGGGASGEDAPPFTQGTPSGA